MGISSNLNQLNDISFDSAYNTLCGMTRSEIEATFAPELLQMTEKNKTDHPGSYGENDADVRRIPLHPR